MSNDNILANRLNKTAEMLLLYNGKSPLHLWLREQFNLHRNWGSRDRRFYRDACYSFFRFNPGFKAETCTAANIAICLRLSGSAEISNSYLKANLKDFTEASEEPAMRPMPEEANTAVWSRMDSLMDPAINRDRYREAFEKPAPVWTIASKGREKQYTIILAQLGIPYTAIGRAVKLAANQNLDKVPASYYRVMDISTQQSMDGITLSGKIWDCCSGSGGKALLISESNPKAELYCSDVRANILENLEDRFAASRLNKPAITVFDLQKDSVLSFNGQEIPENHFDLLVADVPCTGSGTWRRNPENLHYFEPEQLKEYADLQRSIVVRASKHLKKKGRLVYLTCSVFDAENGQNVAWLEQQGLKWMETAYFGGPETDGDYLFRAVFEKQ